MTAPLPTPYDIVDLPPLPWEPDARTWTILLLCLVILYLVVKLFSRHAPQHFARSAREQIESHLRILAEGGHPVTRKECARTSHDIRRYLEAVLGIPLRGGYLEGLHDEISPARRSTLEAIEVRLRMLDNARYAPDDGSIPERSVFHELLILLEEASPAKMMEENSNVS